MSPGGRKVRNLPFFGQHLYTLVRLRGEASDCFEAWLMAAVMAVLEERRLLKAIRSGSREACAEVVRRHYGPIYGFLLHLSAQANTAEDLTQETFATAWKAIGSFRGRSSFATWLHRIAYGKFIDFKRRDKRGQAVMEQLADRQSSSTALRSPLAQALANERGRYVYEAVGKLDEADREVIVLHYFQSLSFSQMATVLDEPLGTVKWRTSRALGKLKISLDGRI